MRYLKVKFVGWILASWFLWFHEANLDDDLDNKKMATYFGNETSTTTLQITTGRCAISHLVWIQIVLII